MAGGRHGDGDAPTAALPSGAFSGAFLLRVVIADRVETHALPPAGEVVIGRGDKADVAIADPSVSRRHVILHLGEDLQLEDLGSRHGTRVNGRKLAAGERVVVRPGEPIDFGTVLVVVQRRPDEGVAAPGGDPLAIEPAMRSLLELVDRFAAGNISVLLLGETGVGKEVTADLLHRRSPRAKKPLLRLNCAAFTESLLESELFGHERGAFTGAVQAKPGLLETAQGGSVFLDEVGELPMGLQVKLLRVLEERSVTRVGGLRPIPIDVRFIAATNRDLNAEVASGRFRADLLFRLDGATLRIPPLRERPSELEPLARGFLAGFAAQVGTPTPQLTEAALARMRAYAWPGNVRELRNFMERAVLLSRGAPITLEHLPLDKMGVAEVAPRGAEGAQLWGDLKQRERERILAALEQCGGNQTRAAKQLGISRGTLITRLAEYGVAKTRKPSAPK